MVNGGTTIHTASGATVTVRRRGIEYDLETRNARGETISTVVMDQDDLDALFAEMGEHVDDEGYDKGYRDGYDKGYDDGYEDAEVAA